jgi:hypothetical protein
MGDLETVIDDIVNLIGNTAQQGDQRDVRRLDRALQNLLDVLEGGQTHHHRHHHKHHGFGQGFAQFSSGVFGIQAGSFDQGTGSRDNQGNHSSSQRQKGGSFGEGLSMVGSCGGGKDRGRNRSEQAGDPGTGSRGSFGKGLNQMAGCCSSRDSNSAMSAGNSSGKGDHTHAQSSGKGSGQSTGMTGKNGTDCQQGVAKGGGQTTGATSGKNNGKNSSSNVPAGGIKGGSGGSLTVVRGNGTAGTVKSKTSAMKSSTSGMSTASKGNATKVTGSTAKQGSSRVASGATQASKKGGIPAGTRVGKGQSGGMKGPGNSGRGNFSAGSRGGSSAVAAMSRPRGGAPAAGFSVGRGSGSHGRRR